MISGIVLQWHGQLNAATWWVILAVTLLIIILFFLLPFFKQYRYAYLNGFFISIIGFSLGALLAADRDIRNERQWLGNFYQPKDGIIVTLDEPPVEKTKSIKANASVSYLIQNGAAKAVTGKIILYFKKDSLLKLDYGSQVLLKKPLQEIKNSGNPGGFDYKRYCLFQQITHQVYLKPGEFEILEGKKQTAFKNFIYATRDWVLNILRTNIKGERELGLAEALLIGYKDDLEQSLVQSYTNTGVVHIIAISGLHLGLIYWLLSILCKPLKKNKNTRWLSPVIIITGLWLFSLLAGAQPSILRSAVMFTCIVLGESLSRRSSIYNTMAVSASILLCINPYWLWDVGFQLSYAAVLSIIIFMRPIYNWFYIKNKALDFIWKLNAVTLAAQILTVPLSIYHFHQFPNLFFITNFVAVPLSSIILLGEIFLCVIFFIPALATLVGKVLEWLIWLMNSYIERIEVIKFSLWDGLQINIIQAVLLVLFAAGISRWLMDKSTAGLKLGLVSLLGFIGMRSYSFIKSNQQQKVVVYNVPQKTAIDFINGRDYKFVGDSTLLADDFARNFHLKPARILFRIKETTMLSNLRTTDNYFDYNGKRILLLDSTMAFTTQEIKPTIDLLVISKNPKIYMKKLAASVYIKQVVLDGSVPTWKANYWKKDCDSLKIPWHDVTTKGAFVMEIE